MSNQLPKIYVRMHEEKRAGDVLKMYTFPNDNSLNALIRDLPQRTWRFDHWTVPITEANVRLIAQQMGEYPDSFDLDTGAQLTLKVEAMRVGLQERKAKKRAEFVFTDEPPDLPVLPDGNPLAFKHPPYKHQQVALHSSLKEEGFALLMEMGTGKTFVCVMRTNWECSVKSGSQAEAAKPLNGTAALMYRVLIICPKSLIHVWKNEFEKFSTIPFDFAGLRGRAEDRIDSIIDCLRGPARLKVIAINYESVRKYEQLLKAFKFDLAIADESTRIKTPGAKRTKASIRVGQACRQRMILTGTPVTNHVGDLYSQFEFLSPGCLGYTSNKAFQETFVFKDPFSGQFKVRQVHVLKQRVARWSFIVKKKDCLDLPEKIYQTRDIYLEGHQKTAYNTMREAFLAELMAGALDNNVTGARVKVLADPAGMAPPSLTKVTAKIVLTKYLRLTQITSGFVKTDDNRIVEFQPNPKLAECISVIEELPDDQKVIVWARFKHDIHAIQRELSARGINSVRYDGSTSGDMDAAALDEFEHNDLCRVFIGNPAKGGVGLTLLGSEECPVTTTIYYSNDFSLEKRLQSEDRCHRVGLKNPITYIDLIVPGSIDSSVVKALQAKTNLLNQFTDVQDMAICILGKAIE